MGRRVDDVGHCKAAGAACQRFFPGHRGVVPRLDGGNARAAAGRDGSSRALHDLVVRAVAGEGSNASRRAGGDKDIVVVQIVVLVAVVQRHGADRPGKERIFEATAKQRQGCVRLKIFMDGIHVQPYIAPGVKVADGHRAAALGTGAGDRAAAGAAVADRAGAAGAHLTLGSL